MKNYRIFLFAICFIILVCLIFIGHTWHLFPAYLACFLASLILIFKKYKKRKVLTISVCTFFLVITGLSFYLFPLISLPEPTGDYQVGVTYKTIKTDRDEPMTKVSGDKRTIYLKIWYPAEKGTKRAIYFNGGMLTVNTIFELPLPFELNHLAKIKTNTYTNASIASGHFPLLTLSHGYGGWFGQNASLAEHLASKGYIVASIAHSHQAKFAATDENTLINFEKILPLSSPNDTIQGENSQYANFMEAITNISEQQTLDDFLHSFYSVKKTTNDFALIWAADISSTIDLMVQENDNTASVFYDKIDFTKVGSVGFSFGGVASVQATFSDNRIKAAVNMDGKLYGTFMNDTTDVPILFLESLKSPYKLSMYNPFYNHSTSQISCLMFEDAKHTNFTDINLFSPLLKYMGVLGKVNRKYMMTKINTIVPDFFSSTFGDSLFQPEKYLEDGKIISPNL